MGGVALAKTDISVSEICASNREIILGGGTWEIKEVCLRQLRFSQPLAFRSPSFLLIPSNGNESVGVTAKTQEQAVFSGGRVRATNKQTREDSKIFLLLKWAILF